MTNKQAVKFHYDKAGDFAVAEVERMARQILLTHPNLNEFIMGMGLACFTDKADNSLDTSDRRYMKPLDDFISEWDEYLKITGEPMRFTATGKKITSWGGYNTSGREN